MKPKDRYKNILPVVITTNGKPLPAAIEIEELVLGTCMSFTDKVGETRLKPEMFYKEGNRAIFEAILELSRKGSCDLFSVTEHLRAKGELDEAGGPVAITRMTSICYSDQLIAEHSLIIKQNYLLREYIRMGLQLANMSYTEDLADVIEFAESNLMKLSDLTQIKEPRHIEVCVDEYLAGLEKLTKVIGHLSGVPSGLSTLDRLTGGWQPQDLIIIAARPSMGKTATALSLIKGAAELKYPAAVFSLEMSEAQLTGRYLSSVSGYTNMELRNGKVDMRHVNDSAWKLTGLPIFIDDTPAIGLLELRSKAKKLILKYGVRLIAVDYLQLMKADANSREQEVSMISRGLKSIAKELNVPVIALSQLNRDVEKTADKRPKLSDLRESGAIEQDADLVCFLWRPAYYHLPTFELNGNPDYPSEGIMVFDIAKNRNGACGPIALKHNPPMTVITNITETYDHRNP